MSDLRRIPVVRGAAGDGDSLANTDHSSKAAIAETTSIADEVI